VISFVIPPHISARPLSIVLMIQMAKLLMLVVVTLLVINAKPLNQKKIQSRDPCNRRNIHLSVGDDKHLPLLAGGGYIHHRSYLSSTPATAATASSGGTGMPFQGGSRVLVDQSLSGPNTKEDTGELSCRNSTMNPVFALAARD
jgi:hypothetical protein